MPRRHDTEQVDAAARAAALTRGGRLALGELLEQGKAAGAGGAKNARGDFTPEELRDEARGVRAPVVERDLARSAVLLAEERAVRALAGATVITVRTALDGTACVHLGDVTLRLPPTGWLLREDGTDLARAEDEPAYALAQLRTLVGCRVVRADVRRHDRALALELDDELELLVRGAEVAAWELVEEGDRAAHSG